MRSQTNDVADQVKFATVLMAWDNIFELVAPCMIREAAEYTIRTALTEAVAKREKVEGGVFSSAAEIYSESFHKVMVQLRALGLITPSTERRSVKDRGTTYWSLTPYGDDYMNRLLAIRTTQQPSN